MDNCADHSAHERAIKQHDKRLDTHGEQLDTLNETLATLRVIEQQNQKRLDGHDERISALEAAPAKKWETITNYALTAIIALVLGIVAGHFGL